MASLSQAVPVRAGWRDYLELTKPKVVALMIITSAIGMLLASEQAVPWSTLLLGNLGIALCAGSAAAINHVVDRRIDIHMARTQRRPLAQGRVDPLNAVLFAILLGSAGLAVLLSWTNTLTALLTLASLLGYALIYTAFLKRATPQNIVIGGVAGAAPPLLGWTAVTGQIQAEGLLLVLIIFAWTPPHFWALAIHRKAEYAKVDIPMLPVTHGEHYTKLHILLYTFILLAVSLLPFVIHMSGPLYLVAAVALGLRFIDWAVALLRDSRPHAAIKTFKYSLWYLLWLFVALLLDHYIEVAGWL
ncbi:heme o synthase [Halopseudomonas aestusnigri]|jgi:protoheme IX farnesyltransferase|uniref:heme o synthase n=1 Tax=Halopseudomonas aestusnigri TaxID=857252 RepID=UPI000C51C3D2|nr:heme o synthase [Halopseudomonas aestusnigri]MAK72929.1 protoheme IX farnesyltransferase [Pseudomonadales bacterium]HBT57606.1 protoheme IX farnesyltransferase [Pseudomonas sp.]MAY08258.1 protoheme IX farnesyltransferase [Pseudomonadales bacterium]UGV30718.1 heme o synthase [Halopseudomonas aestusnigri]HCP02817.1 protoheme IX farnesyltransferase [Pseudomonas sp.]|tara:strand:+ start:2681 stop:3586 length:906 start_codon:yes stop_codon:yes gene_type:complete